MQLTRRETFSSAHRLHSKQLSDAQNSDIFGKCNNQNGHGHNYCIEVTVNGSVDLTTGMLMNTSELKSVIKEVVSLVDHKHLDLDVQWFSNKVSTTENLAIFFWEHLRPQLPQLYKIKIHETENNTVTYKGPTM